MTSHTPQPLADWRCPECNCHSFAYVDERKPDGSFGPSGNKRCVNCKMVFAPQPSGDDPQGYDWMEPDLIAAGKPESKAMITLEDIDDAENTIRNIRSILQGIGRELHEMREGSKLGSEYSFVQYKRTKFCGTNYVGQDGPDWGVGTLIFSLQYYWSRGEDDLSVTFPQEWLEQDWRALEQARLDKERTALEAQEQAERARAAREHEESEREAYERLRAKYGEG